MYRRFIYQKKNQIILFNNNYYFNLQTCIREYMYVGINFYLMSILHFNFRFGFVFDIHTYICIVDKI